jgi:hypothetical protein
MFHTLNQQLAQQVTELDGHMLNVLCVNPLDEASP